VKQNPLKREFGARHRKARAQGDTVEADATASPRQQSQPLNLIIGDVGKKNAAGKMSMNLVEAAVTRANKAETWQGADDGHVLYFDRRHRQVATRSVNENGAIYTRVAGAITSCATAASSLAGVCIAANCDFANSDCSVGTTFTSFTSLARRSFCAKAKAALTFHDCFPAAIQRFELYVSGSAFSKVALKESLAISCVTQVAASCGGSII
jgi:hypothetical protein